MIRFCIAIAVLFFSTMSVAAPQLSGNPQELKRYLQSRTDRVTIQKTATETAYTDRAKISLTVTTNHKLLAEAMRLNQSLRTATVREFTAAGIPPDAIHTSRFSTSPRYGWFGKEPNSFKVINTITVTAENAQQFQAVAEVADQHREIRFARTEFEHSRKEEFQKMVRQKAMDRIMEERHFYEQRLGLRLSPVRFQVADVMPHSPRFQPPVEEVVVTAHKQGGANEQIEQQAAGFDEIEYRASVAVVFHIEAAQ